MNNTMPVVPTTNRWKVQIRKFAGIATALLLCAAFTPSAQATFVLSNAVFSGSVSTKYPSNYETFTQSGSYSGVLGPDSYSLMMSGQTNSVSGSDNIGTSLSEGTSTSEISYSFAVVGPTTTTAIPMIISYTMTGSGLGYYGVLGQISYPNLAVAGGIASQRLCAGPMYTSCAGNVVYGNYYSTTAPFSINANQGYGISLSVLPVARNYGFTAGTQPYSSASGSVDPFLQIDPSFPNAGLYSIVFSPGVVNGTPPSVPEPPSLYLFLFGMLLLGIGRLSIKRRSAIS